ncbi:Serine/threonine-protein kinase brsk1 [Blomia tropicalis]|nr:Serine/threonine-protein kinase brsk1 [Blomia tropicalis]
MPYFERSWKQNVVPRDQSSQSKPERTNIRTIPLMESGELIKQGKKAVEALTKECFEPPNPVELNSTMINQFQDTLSKKVEALSNQPGADPIVEGQSYQFDLYKVDTSEPIFIGKYSSIFHCTKPGVDFPLANRRFRTSALIDPKDDSYLKVLRHLGKQSPFIIATLDIFVDKQNELLIFQEYADLGNGYDLLRNNFKINEPLVQQWAKDIYFAMDFLGNMGICHRSIYPKHLLFCQRSDRVIAKLNGFRDAIVYWDPVENDIIYQQCQPISKALSFHAPESYGNDTDVFDPIQADIWSYGATWFYLITQTYPFRLNDPNLDLLIRNSVAAITEYSDSVKSWLYSLLRTNTLERVDFKAIIEDDWFQRGNSLEDDKVATLNDTTNVPTNNLQPTNLNDINVPANNLPPATLNGSNVPINNIQLANLIGGGVPTFHFQPATLNGGSIPINFQPAALNGGNVQTINLQPTTFNSSNVQPINLQPATLDGSNVSANNLQPTTMNVDNVPTDNLQPATLIGGNILANNLQPTLDGGNVPANNLQSTTSDGQAQK